MREIFKKYYYQKSNLTDEKYRFTCMTSHYNTLCIIVDVKTRKIIDYFIKDTEVRSKKSLEFLEEDLEMIEFDVKRIQEELDAKGTN